MGGIFVKTKNNIVIYVDPQEDYSNQKNIVGDKAVFAVRGIYKNFDYEAITNNIKDIVLKMASIMEDSYLEKTNCEVDEIEFSIAINAEGTISILSTVSANASANTGIVIKLKKKKNEC